MSKLILEVLTGPLDGATRELAGEAEWSRAGTGLYRSPGTPSWGRPRPTSGQRRTAGAWKGSKPLTARTGSTGRSGLRRRFPSPRAIS